MLILFIVNDSHIHTVFLAWLFWLWLNCQQQAGLLLKFWAFWNVWPWRSPNKVQTLGSEFGHRYSYGLYCLELTQHVCSVLPSPVTLIFQLLSSPAAPPSERKMSRCMRPQCSFACCQTGNGPWQADSWLPRRPPWSAVICCTVSHSYRGSKCGHWQAILDRNSSIRLSEQTTLP